MAKSPDESIMQAIEEAATLYQRLVLVVAPAGKGKTAALSSIQKRTGDPLINLNLALSQRMLELTERQRALQLPRLLGEIVEACPGGVILLDNIEMLFDPALKQDPLRLLQGLSRNRTVVAAWNGAISGGYLTCAVPGHPEYRRYPLEGLRVVELEGWSR